MIPHPRISASVPAMAQRGGVNRWVPAKQFDEHDLAGRACVRHRSMRANGAQAARPAVDDHDLAQRLVVHQALPERDDTRKCPAADPSHMI
jgi:hypothetical protein